MRWLRTLLRDSDDDHYNVTIDLLVDDDNVVVGRVPFCGWWGKLGSTEILPIIVLSDGRVDFGSDEDTDQNNRFGRIRIQGRKIKIGEPVEFDDGEDGYLLRIHGARDLTEGEF